MYNLLVPRLSDTTIDIQVINVLDSILNIQNLEIKIGYVVKIKELSKNNVVFLSK